MEGNIEEVIPAFSMWKMFNNTVIPWLLNVEYSGNKLIKLAQITKTENFLDIFVFQYDSLMSYEEHNTVSRKYKTFTMWLLGRFFYVLGYEQTSEMHDFLINVQWEILQHLSIRESHIYEELTTQYAAALKLLNAFHKNYESNQTESKTVLEIFVANEDADLNTVLDLSPLFIEIGSESVCTNLHLKVITIIHKIILQNIHCNFLNDVTYDITEGLLYVLSYCNITLKLRVLEIYIDLLKSYLFHPPAMPFKFADKFNSFVNYIEPFVYNVYNKIVEIGELEATRFENIVAAFLNSGKKYDSLLGRIQRIALFLLYKKTSEPLQCALCDVISNMEKLEGSHQQSMIDFCINDGIEKDAHHLLKIVGKEMINEVKMLAVLKTPRAVCLYSRNTDTTWTTLLEKLKEKLMKNKCGKTDCMYLNNLSIFNHVLEVLVQVNIEIKRDLIKSSDGSSVKFFEEGDFSGLMEIIVKNHKDCGYRDVKDAGLLLQKIFIHSVVQTFVSCSAFFHGLVFPLIKQTFPGDPIFKIIYPLLESQCFLKEIAIKYLQKYFRCLEAFPHGAITSAEYFKIVNIYIHGTENNSIAFEDLGSFLYFPATEYTENGRKRWINKILLPALHKHPKLQVAALKSICEIICNSYSHYLPIMLWNLDQNELDFQKYCLACTKELVGGLHNRNIRDSFIENYQWKNKCKAAAVEVKQPFSGSSDIFKDVIQQLVITLDQANSEFKMEFIKHLKCFAHVESFHTISIAKCWLKFSDDDDKEVRMLFVTVCASFFENILENPSLSKEYKNELMQFSFSELKIYMKKSLEFSNTELQDTVHNTLEELSRLKFDNVLLNTTQLLLFFILIPTSQYSLHATDTLISMAREHNTTTNLIYFQHIKELSQAIAELCAINQALCNYNLQTSLEVISFALGYFGPKDFIVKESRHLLPYFISILVKMPEVATLVEEIATLKDLDLSNLLISNYGHIFLHLVLNENDDGFKNATTYLEEITGQSGVALRRGDFQIILNELLLHFHEKRDRVLQAIIIFAREDMDVKLQKTLTIAQIPEYLQPRLLGVLAYFDFKLNFLLTDKKKVLESLLQLLRFMGAKYITPLRFKILAMLRTSILANYKNFPELNCDIWDAFIKCCEVDALGTQLASIFVFLLPLLEHFPDKINGLFHYLIIENEMFLKDYIPDLFFVLETSVNEEICLVIKRHLERIEKKLFKEQVKWYLKYVRHETIDIRVHGLKHLKRLLEKNREELDLLVLGYNGMDSTIVELLDILMLGCRDKENSIKLACGECIGELGAIEPSHFPRRYTQETKSFVFFITEDAFIVNALNELTRALQAEKNTHQMDRFSLAIQEILKEHGISPDVNSPKHNLWESFSEPHRELMLPLLSSRYKMLQAVENIPVSPIYGTQYGLTFRTWVYNWTCNLVLAVKPNKRALLEVCLPSLKQDQRTLMIFLPHILLHALLDSQNSHEMAYNEFMAVIASFNNRQSLPSHVGNLPSIPSTSSSSNTDYPMGTEELEENQYTAVIFVLLDFLDRCVREWLWSKSQFPQRDTEYQTIKNFLSRFCKLQLARCNYNCGEHPRALMYLEEYLKEKPNALKEQLDFLTEIYSQLNEPDGLAGITALRDKEPPLEQRLRALQGSGKLADAVACYECIPPPLKRHHIQGLIECYLDLDNVNSALNFAKTAIQKQPEFSNLLLESQVEALWRLGRYTELNNVLQLPEMKISNNSWGVEIGRALIHFQDGKRDEFKAVLNALRIAQVESLGAGSLEEGAYQHGYSYVAKLHAINELQQVEGVFYEMLACPNDLKVLETLIKNLTSKWDLRFKVVHESMRIQEPILCLRRVALEQTKQLVKDKVPNSLPFLNSLLGESWLQSAKIARTSGVHQQAYAYTLKAEEYASPSLFIEKAKLHWLREEHEQALTTLNRGLEQLMPEGLTTPSSSFGILTLATKKLAAEAKLLIASYNDLISNVDTHINRLHYREAYEVYKEWEESLVCLAQYYDRIFQATPSGDRDTNDSDTQLIYMITYFGRSLQYGTKYVYQSMPRLLSIWFDYGTRVLEYNTLMDKEYKEERAKTLLRMTKLIDSSLERLPTYVFLTAFSQLVSRICHPQKQVYFELKAIIIKIILQYPQQSLWMIMSMIKSSYPVRTKRCGEILGDCRLATVSMIKLVDDFTKLAEKLIELCNKDLPSNIQTASVNSLLRTLPRLLSKSDFSEIMIPTQMFRKLVLPNPDFDSSQHNPFPNRYVHIAGIVDEITILQSLQRPRKITFRGSDGKLYIQMLKAKDDLRKDFRLMEFNDIVNQLLSRDPDSRQRRLHIRLYSVVPLNEECGILEWIPNLLGLRPILLPLYKQIGMGLTGRELRQYFGNKSDSLIKKRETYTKLILPKFPPILGEWFRKVFPDAQGWLAARTAYIHTTAVISMVGYIVGLGDRHGENILLDSTCGDTVHVDFSCLFNKGEEFECVERVPFRLTHNMVAAMGPLGVEGVFRKSCACTLRVLRANSTMLMSIVTPFVYDPLVVWAKNSLANANAQTAERTNEQAVEHIKNIELRLQGTVRTKGRSSTIPLSVEGQANNLIQEAVSIDNLCQMYYGWAPSM